MKLVKVECFALFTFTLLLGLFINRGLTQNGTSIYYKNFVRHSNGDFCYHTPAIATFTAYLNNDKSIVLIENTPRWDMGSEPNIAGNGTIGVELGNFIDPPIAVGDSVFVRLTCNATKEQGVLTDSVTGIPWFVFPSTLDLKPLNLPPPPQNVTLTIDSTAYNPTISWTQEPGLTYSVYRRTVQDTIFNGQSRRLYTRLAENLSNNSFTDTTTTDSVLYGYIVYAISSEGIVSSHSQEVVDTSRISNLTVAPRATTAILYWNAYISPIGQVKGYNIYRRTDSGFLGPPIAYTGLDTFYIDSRLDLGTTYYYKIRARLDPQTEIGESDEIALTTLPSQNGFYTYANLKVAVVIYQHTNKGSISASDIQKITAMLDVGRLFYWRNSTMKLNTEFSYFHIDDYRDFGDPNNTNVQQTVKDLIALDVMNTQYDIIFRVTPATAGYWSFGVTNLNLPGPSRQTGFSQSYWPVITGVVYPGHLPGINYGLTWIFVHEVQHAIDALYDANGHPEMYHGDQPQHFPIACGEHFDFQAKMLRTFRAYEDLLADWGDIYEAVDADRDGFPDNEPLVALDEARFGSSPLLQDTDSDGYTDKEEAVDGSYGGSNPNDPDTDNDGIPDGQDEYVRYPVANTIQPYRPTIDSDIESEWPLINDTVSYTQEGYSPNLYMSYDTDSLYLALYLPNIGLPKLTFDFHGDGWWHSSGNTFMRINVSTGNFAEFRSWDASPEVRAYSNSIGKGDAGMWDDDPDYQQHFHRRVVYPNSVNLKVNLNFPVIQIEMAIPKTEYAGLTLRSGDSIGLNINYSKVNNDINQWATTFDQYSFAYFVLTGIVSIETTDSNAEVIYQFNLEQNYPNPFNPTTTIQYALPRQSNVSLLIYNVSGQKVRELVNKQQTTGKYQVIWDGRNDAGREVSSGIYLYTMTAGNFKNTGKMVLIR